MRPGKRTISWHENVTKLKIKAWNFIQCHLSMINEMLCTMNERSWWDLYISILGTMMSECRNYDDWTRKLRDQLTRVQKFSGRSRMIQSICTCIRFSMLGFYSRIKPSSILPDSDYASKSLDIFYFEIHFRIIDHIATFFHDIHTKAYRSFFNGI